MRGDCSVRINGIGFSREQIAACSQQQGLLSIEIELSAVADCHCAHCLSTSPQPVLSSSEIINVIDQAQAMGATRVILIDSNTGAYASLRSIIQDCHSKNLQVELFASDTEITADFAKFLVDHRVSVAVELPKHASAIHHLKQAKDLPPSPGTPGEGRVEGDFELQESLDIQTHPHPNLLPEYREKGPEIALRLFVTPENIERIPQTWREARADGIQPHLQIITPADNPAPPSPARIRELFETLAKIDQTEFNIPWDHPPELTGRSCKRHLFAAHVTACGTLFACVGITIPLGNIRTEPLAEILKLSEVIEDIRAFDEKIKQPCRTCSKTVDCYGCRGSAYQLTGDYLAGDALCWKADGVPIESLPVSVAHIIPHGPTIRMVDQLVQLGERRATTSFEVKKDSLWVDANGKLDEVAYIEIIAQSFATSHGFHLTAEERAAHRGLLLGISNVTVTGKSQAGDRLTIEIRKITRFGDFGIVEGEVRHEDGRLIAVAQVKVWRPSDESAKAMLP